VWDRLDKEVRFEIDQIKTLLDRYAMILHAAADGADDDTTTLALGGVLRTLCDEIESFRSTAGEKPE